MGRGSVMCIIPAREHVSTGVFLRNRARAGLRAGEILGENPYHRNISSVQRAYGSDSAVNGRGL